MEVIEFKTKIKDGKIQIPNKYKQKLSDTVKVIIFADKKTDKNDIIDELLANPIKMDNFLPLSRDEIYDRF